MMGVYAVCVGDCVYVGATANLERRKREHELLLQRGKHPNEELQHAFKDQLAFKFTVLETTSDVTLLKEKEALWAHKMRSIDSRKPYPVNDSTTCSIRWRLREFMKEHGITQKELEEASGIPQSQISRLPKVSRAEFATLHKLLPALSSLTGNDVDIGDILEYVKPESP